MSLAPPPAGPPPALKAAPAPVTTKPGAWKTGSEAPKPPRIIINGVEGVGKTSIASNAPGAAIIMARDETGYETLLGSERVPEVPRMHVTSWPELLATVQALAKSPGEIKTLVIDALGGFERICWEYVCATEFGNDWGKKGFANYAQGPDLAVKHWLKLIAALDACHAAGVAVIVLSHVQVKPFKNPEGESYDRYQADCHLKTWAVTHKWADAVLFFNFKQAIDSTGQRVHAVPSGGRERVLHTERTDAFDAKNRYGMPPQIKIINDHTQSWSTLAGNIPFYTTTK